MKIRGFSNLSKKLVTPLLVAGVILGAYAEKVSSGLATRAVNTLIALNGQMDTPIQGRWLPYASVPRRMARLSM